MPLADEDDLIEAPNGTDGHHSLKHHSTRFTIFNNFFMDRFQEMSQAH